MPAPSATRPPVTNIIPLTPVDRCDRCGAQAYVRLLIQPNGELLFCAHHGREHQPAIAAREDLTFQDQSDRLRAEADATRASTHAG